jgi:hypothetical protein
MNGEKFVAASVGKEALKYLVDNTDTVIIDTINQLIQDSFQYHRAFMAKYAPIELDRTISENAKRTYARERAFYAVQHINAKLALDVLRGISPDPSNIDCMLPPEVSYDTPPISTSATISSPVSISSPDVDIDLLNETLRAVLPSLKIDNAKFLAWLCAVRVLPYIFTNNNLAFWKGKQEELAELFNVLDKMAFKSLSVLGIESNSIDVSFAGVYNNSLSFRNNASADDSLAGYGVEAIFLAGRAFASNTDFDVQHYLERSIMTALNVANLSDEKDGDIFRQCVLKDLICVQNIPPSGMRGDISLSAKDTWLTFNSVLTDLECKYWFEEYKNLFVGDFKTGYESRKLRLTLPNMPKTANGIARHMVSYRV